LRSLTAAVRGSRLLDIETLPYIFVVNPHIMRVHKLYKRAFEKLVTFPPVVNAHQDAQFVVMLKDLVQEGVQVRRHPPARATRRARRLTTPRAAPAAQVVPWLARGVHEASLRGASPRLNCNQFLSDMVQSPPRPPPAGARAAGRRPAGHAKTGRAAGVGGDQAARRGSELRQRGCEAAQIAWSS